MTEYIERDALLERAKQTAYYFAVKSILTEIPTIDAVPVVHGRWIETSEGTFCSECNKNPIPVEHYNVCNFTGAYCPNCGAKMDGGVNDA